LLKREIRILGLSSPRRAHFKAIIGVIFRGSLWLDAIVTYIPPKSKKGWLQGLATTLHESKQYSQIKAAIFSSEYVLEHKYQDYRMLSELVNFPVFAITKRRPVRVPRNEFVKILRNRGRIMLWINDYTPERACALYNLGCTEDQSRPEAVILAELVAGALE